MVTDIQRERILTHFCNLYESREKEIVCAPLVYGDLLLIAEKMSLPVEDVAMVLCNELDSILGVT